MDFILSTCANRRYAIPLPLSMPTISPPPSLALTPPRSHSFFSASLISKRTRTLVKFACLSLIISVLLVEHVANAYYTCQWVNRWSTVLSIIRYCLQNLRLSYCHTILVFSNNSFVTATCSLFSKNTCNLHVFMAHFTACINNTRRYWPMSVVPESIVLS